MINLRQATILVSKKYIYLFDKDKLTEVSNIQELKKKIKNSKVDLLLGHDLAHYHVIEFLPKETTDREAIKRELQKLIPSNLNSINWNHDKVVENNKKKDSTSQFWTFALENKILDPFIQTLKNNGIEIDEIGYFPLAVTNSALKTNTPSLTIFLNQKVHFLVARDEANCFTYDLGELDHFKNDITNFITVLSEKHGIKIKKIFAISDRDLSKLEIKMEKPDFKLGNIKFKSLLNKYSITSDKDTKENNVRVKNDEKNVKEELENASSKYGKNTPKLLAVLGIAIIIFLAVVIPKLFSKEEAILEPSLTTDIVANPTTIPTPSPEPFIPQQYSIEVLNAAGVAGLAAEVKTTLENAGFESIGVGNATLVDPQFTEIVTDSNPRLKEYLISILGGDFNVSTSTPSTSINEDYDATIILGIKN